MKFQNLLTGIASSLVFAMQSGGKENMYSLSWFGWAFIGLLTLVLTIYNYYTYGDEFK